MSPRYSSLAVAILLGFGLMSVAEAAQAPIAAIEVSSRVTRPGRDLKASLRHEIEGQVSRLDWSKTEKRGPFVLTTALVKLDTEKGKAGTKVACTVSMALRDQKGGTLRAMITGRARSEGDPGAEVRAEAAAMSGAVSGALRNLPAAVRRLQ